MARQVFFSFYYDRDNWRTQQVRNSNFIGDDATLLPNDWETVEKGGDPAIQKWIDEQLNMRSCTIVLIGQETAGRKWINYEIKKSWELGKGVLGIYVHNLKDSDGEQAPKGQNPFSAFKLGSLNADSIIKTYCGINWQDSKEAYNTIKENIADWVEQAIKLRGEHPKDSLLEQVKGEYSKGTIINPHKPWFN